MGKEKFRFQVEGIYNEDVCIFNALKENEVIEFEKLIQNNVNLFLYKQSEFVSNELNLEIIGTLLVQKGFNDVFTLYIVEIKNKFFISRLFVRSA